VLRLASSLGAVLLLSVFLFPGISNGADDRSGKGGTLKYTDQTGEPKKAAAQTEKKPMAGGSKLMSSEGMVLDLVGEDFIVANERKFLVTGETRIMTRIGTQTYLRLLRLRSILNIEYHADKSRNLVADSITVME